MDTIILLAIWIGIGFWTASVMKPKGYGSFVSWALGLFGGIFGVIVAYALPNK